MYITIKTVNKCIYISSFICIAGKDDLQYCGPPLHLADCFFSCAWTFEFHEVPLVNCWPWFSWTNEVLFIMSFPTPISCSIWPMFSSSSFSLSDFTSASLIHLKLVLCKVIDICLISSAYGQLVFFVSFAKYAFFSLDYVFLHTKWPKLCVCMFRSWFRSVIKSYNETSVT